MEQAISKYRNAIETCFRWERMIFEHDEGKFNDVKDKLWTEVLDPEFDLDSYFELSELYQVNRVKFQRDTKAISDRIKVRQQNLVNQFIQTGYCDFKEIEINKLLNENVHILQSLVKEPFKAFHYQMLYSNLRFNHNEHLITIEAERNEIAKRLQASKTRPKKLENSFNAINSKLEFLHKLKLLVGMRNSEINFYALEPYITTIRQSKEVSRFSIAFMIYLQLERIREYFESQINKVEEEGDTSPDYSLPVQNRVESHFKVLTFKFRGSRIVGVKGHNIQREEKMFDEELLELYSLPVGFNKTAYYDRICQAFEKENECFALVKDWITDFNLYSIGKLPLPDGNVDGYFMNGLNKVYTKYLLGGRLKISNWKERNGKRIDGEFIKSFTSLLAAKRNFLLKLKDALFELQNPKTGSEKVPESSLRHGNIIQPKETDSITQKIEERLQEVKDRIPHDYDILVSALAQYFETGIFPDDVSVIRVQRINKKAFGWILYSIYTVLKPEEKLSYQYLLFAKQNISKFQRDDLPEVGYSKCNLYRYFTQKTPLK